MTKLESKKYFEPTLALFVCSVCCACVWDEMSPTPLCATPKKKKEAGRGGRKIKNKNEIEGSNIFEDALP